jgi:uncharacterized protein YndB with AHSA1/START domain
MNDMATHEKIVVEDVFPHPPAVVWRALTDGALMARWMMEPKGFAPVAGNEFTYQTKPGGAWDGVIHCQVLEVVPLRLLRFSWKGGHPSNEGYGSPLDTVVAFLLTPTEAGTRLRLEHTGFVLPRNRSAYDSIGGGWPVVLGRLGACLNDRNP